MYRSVAVRLVVKTVGELLLDYMPSAPAMNKWLASILYVMLAYPGQLDAWAHGSCLDDGAQP